jgi:hypothetical protein
MSTPVVELRSASRCRGAAAVSSGARANVIRRKADRRGWALSLQADAGGLDPR